LKMLLRLILVALFRTFAIQPALKSAFLTADELRRHPDHQGVLPFGYRIVSQSEAPIKLQVD
jgi:hypothetical protein